MKNVKRFLSGDPESGAKGRVEFEDGSIVDIDIVFLATGYEIGYPFLDAENICGLNQNQVSLYKFMWPLKHKNIAFIGLVQPYGTFN
jgi:dimethylaniline monooxygenase (N-oxide forming)